MSYRDKLGILNLRVFPNEKAMSTVEVRLYATLRKYYPSLGIGEPLVITLDDKTKLENLFDKLKIPKEEIKVALVNGKREEETYLLEEGDRIGIFSPIGGG